MHGTDPPADATGDASAPPVEALVARALQGFCERGPLAVDELLAAHPAEASAVRARLEVLRRFGLLEEPASARTPARLGPYRILRTLGSGGMGVVHVALDERLERLVALKTVRAPFELEGRSRERFRREVRAVAQLDHEGIVPIYDVGEEDGVPWFAMQLVDGHTLAEELAATRQANGASAAPSSLAQIERGARLARDVARALEHAHARGIVHRDVKPGNVLVDGADRARLFDFGLAQLESDATLTQSGDFIGTPHYLSPEQVAGGPRAAGPTGDIWALSVTLYELLAGQRPFQGPSAHHVFRAIEASDARDLARVNPRVPRDLARIVGMGMAREPERRYLSAEALADDLERFLAGQPVAASTPGALARAGRFARRYRGPVLGAALVFVVLSASLAVVLGALREARSAEDLAEAHLADTERLADQLLLSELQAQATDLYPADSRSVPALERWLERYAELEGCSSLHAEFAARFEERLLAQQRAAGQLGPEARAPDLEAATLEERWKASTTRELLAGLAAARPLAEELRARLGAARGLGERTLVAPAAQWRAAAAAVGADPRFAGLALAPIEGLVPLGPDPRSGLWEFWHVGSGSEPRRADGGSLAMDPDAGLVLVLVPGGRTFIGAVPPGADTGLGELDPGGAAHRDPLAVNEEGPVHAVTLAPFLVSKFELTQGQWLRLAGANPAHYHTATALPGGHWLTLAHPIENVSWDDCVRILARADLALPTEAQWEHSARAGSSTPWWTGEDPASLAGAANTADRAALRAKAPDFWRCEEHFDDGHVVHAPVGSFAANDFGLHDVHGNVSEWCLDVFDYYDYPVEGPAALRASRDHSEARIVRGGFFGNPTGAARSAARFYTSPRSATHMTGVRPARDLSPVPPPAAAQGRSPAD